MQDKGVGGTGAADVAGATPKDTGAVGVGTAAAGVGTGGAGGAGVSAGVDGVGTGEAGSRAGATPLGTALLMVWILTDECFSVFLHPASNPSLVF